MKYAKCWVYPEVNIIIRQSKKGSEEKAKEIEVINCFNKNKGNYGRIRIRKELLKKGTVVSEYRIAKKILKANGLETKSGRTGKKKKHKPSEQQYIEENLIKNKFDVTIPNCLSSLFAVCS